MDKKRPLLRLKRDKVIPADEDLRVEMGVYDLLLPCRRFDITYKVAVLKQVSPTLEFLLRLIKAIPGVGEIEAKQFFGYSRTEMEYVLGEASAPGYIEREGGRLWLTGPGEGLFSESEDGPAIFSVEERRGSFGFDLLANAPETPRRLDGMEMALPDLGLQLESGAGSVSQKIPDRFRRFFRELGDRKDREQIQRRDLYSIDKVTAGDRYQVPVRVRVYAPASNPSHGEFDLSSWRPDHELAERPQVEQAAGRFLEELQVSANSRTDAIAYQTLIDLAPEFFKDFTTRNGLSVNRYWREAAARAGEVRSDRKTIPMVGALANHANIERLLRVVEYGQRQSVQPTVIFWVPPQNLYWGATSLLRDTLAVLRRKLRAEAIDLDDTDPRSICVTPGKPAKYLEQAFDKIELIDTVGLAPALEVLVVPQVCVCALVHAAIGSSSGTAAPLGFASFDGAVLDRAHSLLADRVIRYVKDNALRSEIERAMFETAEGAAPV
jgi:hypothetical protein